MAPANSTDTKSRTSPTLEMFEGFSVFHNLQQSMASSPRQSSLGAEYSHPKALVTSSNIKDFFLPVILCLHDSSSSATIFQSQLRHMEQELGNRFRFVYVNGPFRSNPDRKVLPAFESTGSFYSWVKDMPSSGSEKEDLPQEEIDSIDRVLNQAMMFEGRPDRIWGILGLGQGARLAGGLICRVGDRLESGEKFRALKNLQFGIIISGAWPPIMLTEQKKGWIDVLGLQQLPTLYVWGQRAPDHKSYMKMVSKCDWLHMYTYELKGPQYLPVTEEETEELATRIINLALVPILWVCLIPFRFLSTPDYGVAKLAPLTGGVSSELRNTVVLVLDTSDFGVADVWLEGSQFQTANYPFPIRSLPENAKVPTIRWSRAYSQSSKNTFEFAVKNNHFENLGPGSSRSLAF